MQGGLHELWRLAASDKLDVLLQPQLELEVALLQTNEQSTTNSETGVERVAGLHSFSSRPACCRCTNSDSPGSCPLSDSAQSSDTARTHPRPQAARSSSRAPKPWHSPSIHSAADSPQAACSAGPATTPRTLRRLGSGCRTGPADAPAGGARQRAEHTLRHAERSACA